MVRTLVSALVLVVVLGLVFLAFFATTLIVVIALVVLVRSLFLTTNEFSIRCV